MAKQCGFGPDDAIIVHSMLMRSCLFVVMIEPDGTTERQVRYEPGSLKSQETIGADISFPCSLIVARGGVCRDWSYNTSFRFTQFMIQSVLDRLGAFSQHTRA